MVKASAKKPTKKAVPAKVARVRIINATSRGRVGKLNGAARIIKRIEWSPSRKITHKMLTAANPPPTAHGAALCISGELRSFAMPLVHNTIKRAADAWRADTFMVYHTDYDARAMTHPHRMGAQSCIYNESTLHYALHVLNPVATSRFNRKGVCSSERRGEFAKASIQFAQIAQSFELARRHEAKHDDVHYKWWIRLRPDALILEQMSPPLPHNGMEEGAFVGRGKLDFLFALTPKAMLSFVEWGRANLLPCPARWVKHPCCMDFAHPMLEGASKNPITWGPNGTHMGRWGKPYLWEEVSTGLVRSSHYIHTFHPVRLRPLTPEESSQLTCQVIGRPSAARKAALHALPATDDLYSLDGMCKRAEWSGVSPYASSRITFLKSEQGQPSDPHWSERYSTSLSCGGHYYLFARRAGSSRRLGTRSRDDIKSWHTIVRRRAGPAQYGEAVPLPEHPAFRAISHNAGFLCDADGMTLLAYGGRDWQGQAGERGLLRLESAAEWPLDRWQPDPMRRPPPVVDGRHGDCLEKRWKFKAGCEFDGRVVPVRFKHRFWLFVRANMDNVSGARHVQVVSSADGISRWSSYRKLEFADYHIEPNNNMCVSTSVHRD